MSMVKDKQSPLPPGLPQIRGRASRLLKNIRSLKYSKHRLSTGRYVIEGQRLTEDALGAGTPLEQVLVSPRLYRSGRGRRLAGAVQAEGVPTAAVTDELMSSLHDTRTHQGILAVARQMKFRMDDLPRQPDSIYVVAHRIQDPGNMGAILRSADAAGADGVFTTEESVDPFNPKTVRTTMGSIFRLPAVVSVKLPDVAEWCRERGVELIAAHLTGELFSRVDFKSAFALVVGREGDGLREADLAFAHRAVRVPMRKGVDSLNVGAAVGVILYEAARQRRYRFRPRRGMR
jgi:TrmH family RNA methyltransferase